ncbi:MAG: FtsQ-type POTRA domain-containing protein [Legionella sp.]|nr:FtsQ-type POTRA domain-containing protein [Legionella sp.]
MRFAILLTFLIFFGTFLAGRLAYLYLADAKRFPINTVKVAASYAHISHQQLEAVLSNHLKESFFSLSVNRLQNELNEINWTDTVYVERVWPDILKIKIVEKKPVALWNGSLMTETGKLFQQGVTTFDVDVPKLKGPASQQMEVLQVYKKLSKILLSYGLKTTGLHLSENQSWILVLGDNTKIYLGKKELSARLKRFCKAYPAVFAQKAEQLASVDLRYPRGMAVQWKQQTEQ